MSVLKHKQLTYIHYHEEPIPINQSINQCIDSVIGKKERKKIYEGLLAAAMTNKSKESVTNVYNRCVLL